MKLHAMHRSHVDGRQKRRQTETAEQQNGRTNPWKENRTKSKRTASAVEPGRDNRRPIWQNEPRKSSNFNGGAIFLPAP